MEYRNPKYLENGWIDCEIDHPKYGWIPFTCDPKDTGAELDTAALFAEMQPYAEPYNPPPQEELDKVAADRVRNKRDGLLAECDWIVIMHTEKGTNIPAAWEIYRQNLRDITAQAGFPHNVTWPEKPE